ncbi:MAG: hypothetical protein JNJ85_10630 [Candidatus Kapabacteria bacterium]|nr:hypothetical protein [Candidatus Kapabacteria bacterium]
MSWITSLTIFSLIVIYYLLYIHPDNRVQDFAVKLYGERISEYLYRLPPWSDYVIRFPNGRCYSYPVSLSPTGDRYEEFNILVDTQTFRFVGEYTGLGSAGGTYSFEDKNYRYTLLFGEEVRMTAQSKKHDS